MDLLVFLDGVGEIARLAPLRRKTPVFHDPEAWSEFTLAWAGSCRFLWIGKDFYGVGYWILASLSIIKVTNFTSLSS